MMGVYEKMEESESFGITASVRRQHGEIDRESLFLDLSSSSLDIASHYVSPPAFTTRGFIACH